MNTRRFLGAACGAVMVVCADPALADGERLFTVRGGVYVPEKPGTILPDAFRAPVLEDIPGVQGKQWVARITSLSAPAQAPQTAVNSPPVNAGTVTAVVSRPVPTGSQTTDTPGRSSAAEGQTAQNAGQNAGQNPANKQTGDASSQQAKPSSFCTILGFSCGLGVTYTHTFGSERVDSVTAIQQAGTGQVYLQAKTSQNDSAAVLGELHHFFLKDQGEGKPPIRDDLTNFRITPNQTIATVKDKDGKEQTVTTTEGFGSLAAHDFGAVLACGPFAFWPAFDEGCGPVAVAAVSADGKGVAQFGLGWAGGIKSVGGADGTGFNLGIGMLFDPNEQILDSRIVNPNTRIVLPAYETQALANPSIALVRRPTHSLFVMISKTLP